jgi:hypothetical protein
MLVPALGGPERRLIEIETGPDLAPLLASLYFDMAPQFSPDGEKIAFVSYRSGNPEIWADHRSVDPPGLLRGLEQPLRRPKAVCRPSWKRTWGSPAAL